MNMQVRIADYVSLLSALSPREVLCQHRATALDADSTARLSVVRATRIDHYFFGGATFSHGRLIFIQVAACN
jgi:hypothetical protein